MLYALQLTVWKKRQQFIYILCICKLSDILLHQLSSPVSKLWVGINQYIIRNVWYISVNFNYFQLFYIAENETSRYNFEV